MLLRAGERRPGAEKLKSDNLVSKLGRIKTEAFELWLFSCVRVRACYVRMCPQLSDADSPGLEVSVRRARYDFS